MSVALRVTFVTTMTMMAVLRWNNWRESRRERALERAQRAAVSLRRTSDLEHELGLQMPCSDTQCPRCSPTGVNALALKIWGKNVAFAMAPTMRMEKK